MDKLQGVRLKRERARNQLKLLNGQIDAFLNAGPYSASCNFNRDTGELTIRAKLESSSDPMWGVQVGEIIHNLRSALDHTVNHLVIPDPKSKNQFPIFKSVGWFEQDGVCKFLNGVSSKAVDLIRSEQPLPKEDGGTGEGELSPLWHLKELSDADKHRLIHVTGAMLQSFQFDFAHLKADAKVRKEVRRGPGPMEQDCVLVRAWFDGFREWPFTKPEIDCKIGTCVAFDQGTPAAGWWELSGTLTDIANRTDRILRRVAEEIFDTEL